MIWPNYETMYCRSESNKAIHYNFWWQHNRVFIYMYINFQLITFDDNIVECSFTCILIFNFILMIWNRYETMFYHIQRATAIHDDVGLQHRMWGCGWDNMTILGDNYQIIHNRVFIYIYIVFQLSTNDMKQVWNNVWTYSVCYSHSWRLFTATPHRWHWMSQFVLLVPLLWIYT
jgi:hypothetical protein